MPTTMTKLLDLLAVAPQSRDFAALGKGDAAGFERADRLKPGARLLAPQPIFPRFVEAEASGS
ncbi:MAG TPA: hypothetical protein VEK35_01380, partial [Roseiarcus sp.]|nr:hypothetical protein [Roseiarcus sp.]